MTGTMNLKELLPATCARAASSSPSWPSWRSSRCCTRTSSPGQPHQHRPAVLVHPHPGHRHDHRHHRWAHRPLGRLPRGADRRHRRGRLDPVGSAMVVRRARRAGRRAARRVLAGLLGRLRRDPGLHRDAGRHAHLPRADLPGAGQHLALPVRRDLLRDRQRLPERPARRLWRGRLHPGDLRHRRRGVCRERLAAASGRRRLQARGRGDAAVRPQGAGGRRCRDVVRLPAGPEPRAAQRPGAAGGAHPHLRPHHPEDGLRPQRLRHRCQPHRGPALGRQGAQGQLPHLRQHGPAVRESPASSSPRG